MSKPASDLAFTPAVKALQEARGSRAAYAKREAENRHGGGAFRTLIDDDLRQRLAETFSFYFATANAEGQPYIQHRGGPPAFLFLSMTARSPSPTSPGIGNISRPAISPRTRAPTSS